MHVALERMLSPMMASVLILTDTTLGHSAEVVAVEILQMAIVVLISRLCPSVHNYVDRGSHN
jgi:hypothetical protein